MFDKDQFVEDCKNAIPSGQKAIREIVSKAVSNPTALFAELGEPKKAGISPLFRSDDLTIINFAWAPNMSLMPHNHEMFAVIGIYSGREDNVFWKRTEQSIVASGAKTLGAGDVATLGTNIIHSVMNPINKMTCAIHVYGGDFFDAELPRSGWDHETLVEEPWNADKAKVLFDEANARLIL